MKKQIILIFATFMLAVSSHSQEIVFQKEYDHNERVTCKKVSSNSNFLAVGTKSRVDLIDLNSLESIFESMMGEVVSVDISIDEQRLLALTSDKMIYEWDINTKQLIREINFFANIDSITGVRKAVYYPIDNRIFVDAFFEFQNTNKKYSYLYDNDENVIETGYKSFFNLFEFTTDGDYFIDAGLLSAIVTSDRVPNLQQTLETSDIVETFKDYDPFDKPRAEYLDLSTNNQYALITSDKDDISVIDFYNKGLHTIKKDFSGYVNISTIDNMGSYFIFRGTFEGGLKIFDLNNKNIIYENDNFILATIIDFVEDKSLLFTNAGFGFRIYSFNLDTITNIENTNNETSFNLYPSPTNEQINLEFNSNTAGSFTTQLVDLTGNTLFTYPQDYVNSGLNTFTYNIESYPAGEYFLVTEGIINESFSFIIGE